MTDIFLWKILLSFVGLMIDHQALQFVTSLNDFEWSWPSFKVTWLQESQSYCIHYFISLWIHLNKL